MTLKRRSKNWILVAVAVAVPVLVIVGLRVAAHVEEWPVSIGANTMEQVKGKPLTLYSCDNVAKLSGTPCHEEGDPDLMMVGAPRQAGGRAVGAPPRRRRRHPRAHDRTALHRRDGLGQG